MRSVQLDKALKELESTIKVREHEVTVQSEVAMRESFSSILEEPKTVAKSGGLWTDDAYLSCFVD